MTVKMENIKRKIILATLVILIISLIAVGVYFVKVYLNTDQGRTKIYANELGDVIKLEANKKIISILKYDINKDGIEDYAILLGEAKYEEVDTNVVHMFKALSSNLEMYNNISIEYVDGKDNIISKYDTKKTYGKDVTLNIFDSEKKVYIKASDTSGNITLLYLNEGKLCNVISNTLGDKEFVGYTIEGKFNENDGIKLDITLDNYGKEYLAKKENKFTLDYTNTQVNSKNYRLTYMANKFSKFDIIMQDNKTYLVCTQYVLYSNAESLNKNEGFVNSKFEIKDDGKLEFNMVEVIK